MEKNCLVTTYKAVVNDNSLLKIGEMRLEAGTSTETVGKRINFTTYPQVIETLDGSLSLTNDENLLTGFTNKLTLSADNQFFYTKNQDVVIVVSNKYDVIEVLCKDTKINLDDLKYSPNLKSLENVFCKGSLESIKDKPIRYLFGLQFEKEQNIINLSGLTALTALSMSNTSVFGDISALSRLTAVTTLSMSKTSVFGNISALSRLTKLAILSLGNTQVSGDISALSGLTAVTTLNMSNTSVFGNISALSRLTKLAILSLNNTQVSGDISALSGLTAVTNLNAGGTNISGDIQSLGSCTALTFMELVGMPNMAGEVIDYVISQRAHGRNTGTTRFGPSKTVTFNRKALSDYNRISWTASTITNETTSETVNR